MNPLEVLHIPANYKAPNYLPENSYLAGSPKYSTECSGNNNSVRNLVRKIKRRLAKGQIHLPDFFVGVGNSGMGVASVLSYEFDIPLIHIRKGKIGRYDEEPTENHLLRAGYPNRFIPSYESWGGIENKRKYFAKFGFPDYQEEYWGKTFWFVDDCIDSSTTFQHAIHLCTKGSGMICTGVALTWFTYEKKKRLRELALLKHRNAPMVLISRQAP